MERIILKGRFRECQIFIGASVESIRGHLPGSQFYIVTDNNVSDLYGGLFPGFPVYVLKAGEESKTLGSAADICKWLMDQGAGRDAFLLGIGGGMVCDITGFVASIFMRGIGFGFVASSLLAQVDASIGGKNGVNLEGFKNMMGTFNQPHFVLCNTSMLHTLPKAELQNGLAEVVKHTLISDKKMFMTIREHIHPILELDVEWINKLVAHSVKAKSEIVRRDELEQGERRKLNLGHTWGHAVEKTDGIAHGQAVSIGLAFAARFSEQKGLLSAEEVSLILDLLTSLGLPVKTETDPEKVFRVLVKDKKKESGHIHFVLMNGIGDVLVERIPLDELKQFALTRAH